MSPMTYKGKAKKFLAERGLDIWDKVVVSTETSTFEALILPGPPTEDIIYLKLPNGYNLALKIDRIKSLRKIGSISPSYTLPRMHVSIQQNLPEVSIIHCGGTIASRIEYSTGAVAPAFSLEELSHAVPEIFDLIKPKLTMLFNIFSEHMTPTHWMTIAKTAYKEFISGARAIIVTHGTDTMHFSATAIAFMLHELPGPIIFTGAMRSSDRPSSDAATNLIASAIIASKSDIGESLIVMHAGLNDTDFFAHRGVRSLKLHSTRRDAFRSIGIPPIAEISIARQKISILYPHYKKISNETPKLSAAFEPKTALVPIYPGMSPEIIETLIDKRYRGIVLAGTGLGHVPDYIFKPIQRAIEEKIIVVMTTQCLWGGVYMDVYETGRKLKQIGVIPGKNMLPHVAYIKLGWLLGLDLPDEQVKTLLGKNLLGEIINQESPLCF